MLGVVATGIGLYYPYTHFRDSTWLKFAALYWPKMARVVPRGFPLNDNDVTRALIDDLDFVINLTPASAVPEASHIFHDVLVAHGSELRARHGLNPHFWRSAMDNPLAYDWRQFNRDNYAPSPFDPLRGVGLGQEQIVPGLLQTEEYAEAGRRVFADLTDESEFRRSRQVEARMSIHTFHELSHHELAAPVGDRWVAMSPDIAWVYMCVLAENLAQSNGLSPVTDQDTAHSASFEWTAERVASALLGLDEQRSGHEKAASMAALLALQLVIPARLDSLPVSRIINIRRRYSAEFDAFQDAVTGVADGIRQTIPANADENVLAAQLQVQVDRHFRNPLRDIDKALKSARIDTTLAFGGLKFEVPAAATVGALLVKEPVVGAVTGAALAIFGAARGYAQRRSQTLSPSAVSYLWQVRKAADSRSAIRRMLRHKRTVT